MDQSTQIEYMYVSPTLTSPNSRNADHFVVMRQVDKSKSSMVDLIMVDLEHQAMAAG